MNQASVTAIRQRSAVPGLSVHDASGRPSPASETVAAATPVSIVLGSLRGPAPHPDGSAAKGTVR